MNSKNRLKKVALPPISTKSQPMFWKIEAKIAIYSTAEIILGSSMTSRARADMKK